MKKLITEAWLIEKLDIRIEKSRKNYADWCSKVGDPQRLPKVNFYDGCIYTLKMLKKLIRSAMEDAD